ncbi:polysaccharide deacetylase family protein [Achromobacter sp. 2789STDY5608621]|uniref:polysaccharide deacetylase family protein n=1 Tax=Achromobacter sp. 2789STDY5608621 TaxID=1806496 RepID=UPI0006C6E0DE|nr:polysaccharide deacetylase family protein [Achromobacter sp. 2789STDY5608621]CUI37951.1 putative urate catabolism protein [Achromobacter sp. 2789STDY5608621]
MQAIPYGVPLDAAANPWLALNHELRAEGRRAPSAPPVRAVVCVTVHVDGPAVEVGRKQFPGAGIHTAGRYAIRRGVPRHLEILARHAMPATFFACGYDVEHYPDTFRAILAAGHEIAAHGYLHEAWDLGEDEPALLEKTHTLIQRQLGVTPVGWCSPSGRKSHRTLPTLRRLGYCYDASEKDRDRPYLPAEGGDGFVMLPNNTVSLDDYPFYFTGHSLAAEACDNWIEEFEALRQAEGYIHLTVHPKAAGGSGTPARAAAMDRFLAYVGAQPDVHCMTLAALARHCLAHPAAWRTA